MNTVTILSPRTYTSFIPAGTTDRGMWGLTGESPIFHRETVRMFRKRKCPMPLKHSTFAASNRQKQNQ